MPGLASRIPSLPSYDIIWTGKIIEPDAKVTTMSRRKFMPCTRGTNAIWLYGGAAITVLLLLMK